jgi:arylformamidase
LVIYKQYDQASLDSQYNIRSHVTDFATHLEQWELLSRQTEKEYAVIKDVSYGSLQGEQLDVYPSLLPQSKTLIFIHGGYWHMHDKTTFHFVAGAFRAYGITTILLNYPLAPAFLIDQILLSCRQAIYWLSQNLFQFNGDPRQIYVAGHSAGGHLAAMLLTTDWPRFNKNVSADIIKGGAAISGLFNLKPIQLSYLNKILNMDSEAALRNSVIQLFPTSRSPLILVVGADETEEFKDQSKELYENWKKKNFAVQLMQIPGQNHFSILATILYPTSILHRATLQLMNI